jgi:hypothetical protein
VSGRQPPAVLYRRQPFGTLTALQELLGTLLSLFAGDGFGMDAHSQGKHKK